MKKFLRILGQIEELTVGGLLLLLADGTTVQVFTRSFLGLTFDSFDERTRNLVVFATFAGAGMAVKYGAHFSMEAVTQYSPPRVSACMRTLANVISAAVMLIIAWYGWEQTALLARYGMTTASLGMPMWVAYLPIPVFGATIAVRFLHRAWEQARFVFRPSAEENA